MFKNLVKQDGVSILNVDDEKYEDLRSISRAKVISYGIDRECDYRAINVVIDSHYSRLILFMEETLIKLKPIWLRHIIFIIFLPALPLYMKREWIYRKSLISANIFLKLMDV